MWEKYKTEIIIASLILIAIALIFLYGRKRGLETANGPDVTYPDGGDGIPAGWSPEPLAEELHNVMDGLFTGSETKDDTFRKLLVLPTDDMFVAVYDVFNQEHFSEGDGTLKQWINDEVLTSAFTSTVDQLNDRFDELNLE